MSGAEIFLNCAQTLVSGGKMWYAVAIQIQKASRRKRGLADKTAASLQLPPGVPPKFFPVLTKSSE